MIARAVAHMMIGAMLFTGCSTKRVGSDEQRAAMKTYEILVPGVEYSPMGLPIYPHRLGSRPSAAGDRFTIAQLINDRPIAAFDIVVMGQNADFTKPFKVVYQWTGKGFELGAQGSAKSLDMVSRANFNNREEVVFAFVIVLAPLVAGAAGGFIIGLADGVRTTAREVGKVMLGNYEQVASYTTFAYDARDRLFLMRMYQADESRQELVRTEYAYEGDSALPKKTVITTFPDGAVRTLQ